MALFKKLAGEPTDEDVKEADEAKAAAARKLKILHLTRQTEAYAALIQARAQEMRRVLEDVPAQ
jgi:hypothetical protein